MFGRVAAVVLLALRRRGREHACSAFLILPDAPILSGLAFGAILLGERRTPGDGGVGPRPSRVALVILLVPTRIELRFRDPPPIPRRISVPWRDKWSKQLPWRSLVPS